MEKLQYKTRIAASRQRVWDTMLNLETYKLWTSAGTAGSTYEGRWAKGEDIRFVSPGQGGTMANITELTPHEYLLAKHIAVIGPDGSEERDAAKTNGWIGTTEAYTFTENNGQTELTVDIETGPGWSQMFNEWWPAALNKLKEICEN